MPNQHIWKRRDTKKIQQEKWIVWKKIQDYQEDVLKNRNLSNSTGDYIPILVFKIDILLKNNVDMVLRLIRNPSSFCIMGDANHNYELFIDEAILYMRQVKISPTVMLQHAMALEKATI